MRMKFTVDYNDDGSEDHCFQGQDIEVEVKEDANGAQRVLAIESFIGQVRLALAISTTDEIVADLRARNVWPYNK